MLPVEKGASILRASKSTLLIIHQDPDGDAIASALALFLGLRTLGKETDLVCKDSIPQPFLFLPESSKIQRDFLLGDYEVAVVLDSGDLKRTGFAERLKQNKKQVKYLINIDHHPKNDLHKITDLNIIDFDAAATAVILTKLLAELNVSINWEIATCLLCGIFTDTGGFKHANTTFEVLGLASFLMNRGAKLKNIVDNIANSKTIESLKLWGVVLSRIRRNGWGLVSSVVSWEDISSCQAAPEDLAGIVNLINSIPESRAAVLFSEPEKGLIKASFRTEDKDINVSRLAALFGGGGHEKAAGFTKRGKIVKNKAGLKIVLGEGPNQGQSPLDILDHFLS